jgi:predicted nucleic acid-binding protein
MNRPHRAGTATASSAPASAPGALVRVVVDSGPLIALFCPADHWHQPVVTWLRDHPGAQLFTTWPVMTEVCAMLAHRVRHEAAIDFLRWVQLGAMVVEGADDATLGELLRISERFADLPLDLADASVAEAAGRLGLRNILSIDTDFDVYRDRSGRPLTNLLATS